MKNIKQHSLVILLFFCLSTFAQLENSKWYFGNGSALDFMTTPPSLLSPSSLTVGGLSSSVADASGNLLFYTDGPNIWTATHTVMANGNGPSLVGQTLCLSLKKPASQNLYYVFTSRTNFSITGLYYSVVDMSLAGGQGSVTVKNATLSSVTFGGQITGTRHCNGVDYWVVVRESQTGTSNIVFQSYLLTAAGISTAAVTSSFSILGATYWDVLGYMKISRDGKKLACSNEPYLAATSCPIVELFDFDASTGVVSNHVPLFFPGPIPAGSDIDAAGVEFSPDCSKLYGGYMQGGLSMTSYLIQWDLCAGSNSAIANAQTTLAAFTSTSQGHWFSAFQLGINDKIYLAMVNNTIAAISVINNPNLAGSASNFVLNGQAVQTNQNWRSLPNLVRSLAFPHPTPAPFTYIAGSAFGCQGAQFTAPSVNNLTLTGCTSAGYSVTGYLWDFGDPLSAGSNTSGLSNPIHTFSSLGTYTTQLILYYSCGGGTDTLRQVVNITQPCISVSSTSITCANLGSATVTPAPGLGPYTYTWLPVSQTGSVATGLTPGTHTLVFYDANSNLTFTTSVNFIPLIPLSGNVSNSNSITCHGANTGTGSVTNLSGGSGAQSYLWTNASQSYTTAFTNSLSAGLWTITVTDSLTGCQMNQTFFITQPPALSLNLSSNTQTACLGGAIVLTGTNSGGTPFTVGSAYTYTWTNGSLLDTQSVSETTSGTYIYTLSSSDANSCLVSNTIALNFIANPILTVADVSICPLQTATLSASGATSYTWASATLSLTGITFMDNPMTNTQYTVLGTALGCTSMATASIILKPTPFPMIVDNSPLCEGANLNLVAYGGVSYVWSGINGFSSATQNNTITPVALNQGGVYTVTVTAANGCTASTTKTISVNPSPTLSAVGATVCTSQTLNLIANSNAASFVWTGPQSFTSSLQNPSITSPVLGNTGTYSVKATSAFGCTNSAITTASVVDPPSLTVALSSSSLCSQAFNGSPNTITLTAGGASIYSLVTVPDMSISNPSGPISQLTAIPPNTGIASGTLSGSNGVCTVTTSLTFSIIPNPTVTISSPTPVICAGETYTYTNQGANTYTWTSVTPGFTTYNNGGVAVANPSINSVFSVFGGSLGCNSASQTSSITVNPLPTLSIGPQNPTVCIGSNAILTASGTANSFTWAPYATTNSENGSIVSVNPTSQQTYTVTGSLNSCTSTAMITVSVVSLPSPTVIAIKPAVCLFETITLQGFGGETYDWFGPSVFFDQGQTISFVANVPFYGTTYTLTVTDKNKCRASTTTSITVYNLPVGSLLGTQMKGCVPFTSDFMYYNTAPSASAISTTWQLESKLFSSKSFSADFVKVGTYTIIGNYRDTLTNCINTNTFVVEAYPVPVADYTYLPEKPIENLDQVIFTNTSTGEEQTKWNWYFINNKGFISENKNTSYLFNEAGTYPVAMVVTNTWGCKDTLVKAIKVEADLGVYVPNVFTPNDDYLNDVFLPITRAVKFYELSVYDRWGSKVFSSSDIEKGWDGSYRGEPCKVDVYVWKISLSSVNGEMKMMTGHVTLSR